jgi:hypothetical protein
MGNIDQNRDVFETIGEDLSSVAGGAMSDAAKLDLAHKYMDQKNVAGYAPDWTGAKLGSNGGVLLHHDTGNGKPTWEPTRLDVMHDSVYGVTPHLPKQTVPLWAG